MSWLARLIACRHCEQGNQLCAARPGQSDLPLFDLLHHCLNVDYLTGFGGFNGGEEHGGRLQVVGEGCFRGRAAVEPVEELGWEGLMTVPGDIQQVHLAGLQSIDSTSFLSAHDLVAVEHGGANLAL
jgi:hypothetical protein